VTKNRSPSPTLFLHFQNILLTQRYYAFFASSLSSNTIEAERVVFVGDKQNLSDSAFVNNKLTAKLSRQLEEPMIVARLVLLKSYLAAKY
jgi:E3 ubiquitin-protein ligase TRIP12